MNELKFILVHSRDIELVKRYLPENYYPFFVRMDHMIVVGADNHGWTATDYVIPRLLSALIPASVVTPDEYLTKYGLPVLPPTEGTRGRQFCGLSYWHDGNEFACTLPIGHRGEHGVGKVRV